MCVAIPGQIIWIGQPTSGSTPGRVEFPTGARDVDLFMMPEAKIGDHVIVHAGYAIRIIPSDQAAETWRILSEEPIER